MASIKEKIEDFINDQTVNIAERTFGEEFLKLADAEGMSARYKQSLKIKTDFGKLFLELDYQGDNNEPLGVWFEHGTKDHFIEPKGGGSQFGKISKEFGGKFVGANVLSWVENGQRFFSKGHFVKGIQARQIMERMVRLGLPKFVELFKREVQNG